MKHKLLFTFLSFGLFLFFSVIDVAPALAQPQPQTPEVPVLKPLVRLVSVALNGGVQRPLTSLGSLPAPVPEFTVPRTPNASTSWVLEVRTLDGRGLITFANTVPAGVQPSAFQWEQSGGVSPGTVGRLRYNGCGAGCSASITFQVSVRDSMDNSGAAPSGQIRLNLTASNDRPRNVSITRNGGTTVRPRYTVSFADGTFKAEDSHIVGSYGDLIYRLIPENLNAGSMNVIIPRLKLARGVPVTLSNPLGSAAVNVDLPSQDSESFLPYECINCSIVCVNCSGAFTVTLGDTYSISHNHPSAFGLHGTDEIVLGPKQSGNTPCDQEDFIYTGARSAVLDPVGSVNPTITGRGTARIASEPSVNALLRAPANRIRVDWSKPGVTLESGLISDWWYQVVPKGATVVGICSNRIVN